MERARGASLLGKDDERARWWFDLSIVENLLCFPVDVTARSLHEPLKASTRDIG
jgi:hypothetical protein